MSGKKKINPFAGIVKYFKEVRAELKKVVWPTLKQIQNNTLIVIICLVFVGIIIGILDVGFKSTLGVVVNQARSGEQAIPEFSDEFEIPDEATVPDEVEVPDGVLPQEQGAQSNEQ
ncbi:MAG: preprotein translocase subunit SecE [Firmicutes bacterium ADurb.Bin193]|nr:MAG: preprotein translocase subunit SecE [Firmicutes bacterium ADurb.Bin193]